MNRTEIVLAAIGIISLVSLAGVTVSYSNTLANQQQYQGMLLYYYFGITPGYGIFFTVTNSTDPNNTISITKKITLSQFLALNNSIFTWNKTQGAGQLKTEEGPSLYLVLLTYFNLNITKAVNNASVTLNITASGPESGIIYPSSGIWNINNISTDYPLLDYAEGGGGGSQLYLGTMKLCAPPTGTQQASPISPNEKWIPYNNWVKGLMFITVNFKNISA